MKALFQKLICILTVFFLILSNASAFTREEIRSAYSAVPKLQNIDSPISEKPDYDNFSSGSLSAEAQEQAIAWLNFIRSLTGLEAVSINSLYSLRSQNGAMLLALNDELTHTPPQPVGMDDALYESAYMGTSLGNIAKFNWMKPDMLIDGISYFARDDGEYNLNELSHRRWLLNPLMAETGFGLACSGSGMSYVVMYAVDGGNEGIRWDHVCWPADGCFPVDLMRKNIAWSVSLNDALYDVSSDTLVRMTEENTGAEFLLPADADNPDGFCTVSRDACGSGSCIIFRPNLENAGISAYEQNQIWHVEIGGISNKNGMPVSLEYTCEMISLLPQDPANVEISPLEADMSIGETLQLTAAVIPSYADDCSVSWSCSDESIASVDESGIVTAAAEGECIITVSTVNGRTDSCTLHVKGN